jgi:hypothetical protein
LTDSAALRVLHAEALEEVHPAVPLGVHGDARLGFGDGQVRSDERGVLDLAVLFAGLLQLGLDLLDDVVGRGRAAEGLADGPGRVLPRNHPAVLVVLGVDHDGSDLLELVEGFLVHAADRRENEVRGELGDLLEIDPIGLREPRRLVAAELLDLVIEPVGRVVLVLAPTDVPGTDGDDAQRERDLGVDPAEPDDLLGLGVDLRLAELGFEGHGERIGIRRRAAAGRGRILSVIGARRASGQGERRGGRGGCFQEGATGNGNHNVMYLLVRWGCVRSREAIAGLPGVRMFVTVGCELAPNIRQASSYYGPDRIRTVICD